MKWGTVNTQMSAVDMLDTETLAEHQIFFNNDTLHPPNLMYILYPFRLREVTSNIEDGVAGGTERHIIVTSHGVSNHRHLDCLLSSGAHQENIKAPCHWPLCGESTGDRWIPLTRGR